MDLEIPASGSVRSEMDALDRLHVEMAMSRPRRLPKFRPEPERLDDMIDENLFTAEMMRAAITSARKNGMRVPPFVDRTRIRRGPLGLPVGRGTDGQADSEA